MGEDEFGDSPHLNFRVREDHEAAAHYDSQQRLRAFEIDMAVTEGLKRTAAEYADRQGPGSPWADWANCAAACAAGESIDPRSPVAVHTLAAWREMH